MISERHIEQSPFQAITWAEEQFFSAGVPNPKTDAEHLLAHVLGQKRLDLYLSPRLLEPGQKRLFLSLVRRRCSREPLQYIVGDVSFFSRTFRVNRDVLIPRSETEMLVEECLGRVDRPRRIVDVGTGSGCIAVTLALELPETMITAIDSSDKALAVARENVRQHQIGHRVRLVRGDLTTAIPTHGNADLVVANLPYIPDDEIGNLQREVLDFEPLSALRGGDHGLLLIARLIGDAPRILRKGGLLALEIGDGQEGAVRSIIRDDSRFGAVETKKDLGGYNRMVFVRVSDNG